MSNPPNPTKYKSFYPNRQCAIFSCSISLYRLFLCVECCVKIQNLSYHIILSRIRPINYEYNTCDVDIAVESLKQVFSTLKISFLVHKLRSVHYSDYQYGRKLVNQQFLMNQMNMLSADLDQSWYAKLNHSLNKISF